MESLIVGGDFGGNEDSIGGDDMVSLGEELFFLLGAISLTGVDFRFLGAGGDAPSKRSSSFVQGEIHRYRYGAFLLEESFRRWEYKALSPRKSAQAAQIGTSPKEVPF